MHGEKIIAYLGPSLPLQKAVELCPEVIFRPPARQGDILSDTVEIQPDRILLVDGEFFQNLSPWIKEIIFALSKEIKVYGAASMGALRAADLWRQGMIGCGQIFEWYQSGVTEDDSEVALLYSRSPNGAYVSLTVPLVDIRATIGHYAETLQIKLDHQQALLSAARTIHFSVRTHKRLVEAWISIVGLTTADFLVINLINQKAVDAEQLLLSYPELQPDPAAHPPTEEALSKFFWAQYDRDRQVTINDVRVAQQHVDSYVALHAIDQHQIFWDARNFHLTHMLSEKLGVDINEQDVKRERERFCVRHSLATEEQQGRWIVDNNLTQGEFMILIIRMARVRKLQQWLISSLVPIESTKITLDYLKMHNGYGYWANECAEKEAQLQAKGVDEALSVSGTEPIENQLAAHCQKSGLTIDGAIDDFVSESGFTNPYQLSVALTRLRALE